MKIKRGNYVENFNDKGNHLFKFERQLQTEWIHVYAVAAVGRRTFCIYFELSTLTAIEFL